MDLGSHVQVDGRPAVRFERVYHHPVERVWSAVTESGELARWFPSKMVVEPRQGGTVTFSGDPNITDSTGTVLVYDPPRHLAFTWGADELRFDLETLDGGRCRFVLTNILADPAAAARTAAGWSVCLAELDKHVAGGPADGPHSPTAEPWHEYYDAYLAADFPSGAPVPPRPADG
jgi:uncharacterized protein YndB with AHSA1/START domain